VTVGVPIFTKGSSHDINKLFSIKYDYIQDARQNSYVYTNYNLYRNYSITDVKFQTQHQVVMTSEKNLRIAASLL
jgi:hypothetical protein